MRQAKYRDKTYNLLFLDETKFGRRAKLGFKDGSKEFWVPADQVAVLNSSRECEYCGRPAETQIQGRHLCGGCEREAEESIWQGGYIDL